ncbi:MAG: AAA family ATPase [Candidatus Thiodiazotropha sp.]
MEHSWISGEMYESYFGFKDTPFRLSADERFRYAHKNYLRASAHLAYALEQGEGFVLITGQPGSGKTTLIRDVISELDETSYHTLNLVTSQLQAEELLRKVALEYGFPAESYNKATLLTVIHKHLSTLHEKGKQSILFIDEAQNLSSNGLEELRLLSNLQQGKHSLLQVILAGHEDLRRLLLGPDMEHIQQRLIAICQIDSLPLEQTQAYIIHRLEHAGWQSDPQIEDEVFHLIHMASKGVPRNINHLMNHLLLLAYLEEKHILTDEDALTVIEELVDQQRICLTGEKSFEHLVSNYRVEKKLQTAHHAIANQPGVSFPPNERDHCPIEQQLDNIDTADKSTSNRLTPASDNIAPESDIEPKEPESEYFLRHDNKSREPVKEVDSATGTNTPKSDQARYRNTQTEVSLLNGKGPGPEPRLPNADEIWDGAINTRDMETLFPGSRQQESIITVESPKLQSTTQPVGGEIFEDSEHRWGGVWFMSSGNSTIQPDKYLGQCATTLSDATLPDRSVERMDQCTVVDDSLSIPAVWIEDIPDLTANGNEAFNHSRKVSDKIAILRRSTIHVITLVTIGVMGLLAMKMLPDRISHFYNKTEAQQSDLTGISKQVAPPLNQESAQDTTPANSAEQGKTAKQVIQTSVTPSEQGMAVIQELRGTKVHETSQSDDFSMDMELIANDGTTAHPQSTKKTDAVEVKREAGETVASILIPLEMGESDISSFHNIELAKRYIVYFDFNASDIPSDYTPLLKSIRNKMLLDENNFLKITGYADAQGSGNYNYRLSLKRAEEVKEYFSIRGIADDRLHVAAVGPVENGGARLESIDARRKTRRVEVILFPK